MTAFWIVFIIYAVIAVFTWIVRAMLYYEEQQEMIAASVIWPALAARSVVRGARKVWRDG